MLFYKWIEKNLIHKRLNKEDFEQHLIEFSNKANEYLEAGGFDNNEGISNGYSKTKANNLLKKHNIPFQYVSDKNNTYYILEHK